MDHGAVACHSAVPSHDQLVRRAVANQIIRRTRRQRADGAHCHSDGSARRRAKAAGARAAGCGPLATIAALMAEMAGARPKPHADAQLQLVRRIAELQREKERLLRIIHRVA
ncbi:hypothetical protein H4R18_000649 [Coemansia javaensis]|uniref:Uncharacterized protein n=1 Tax=Coemansia javaensis TaxID=2761396 RepID=A0A9W8HMX3_9FUNG|nr:hypothetical protein H4R18_000649 [Coemansia javaensis]